MRAKSTLLFLFLFVSFAAWAQLPTDNLLKMPMLGMERNFLMPPLAPQQLAAQNVEHVVCKDIATRKHKKDNSELFQFDDQGRLSGMVSLEKSDTSKVSQFAYSASGNVYREEHMDKRWNQATRRNYRLNSDATFLQGKNYEMQGAETVMLLDTRRYTYTDDKVTKISILAGGVVSQVNHFQYDPTTSRLIQERLIGADEALRYQVDYVYNANGRLAEVTRTDFLRGESKEVFRYTYDEQGRMEEATLQENDKLVSTYTYQYDEVGLLTEIAYVTLHGHRKVYGKQTVAYIPFGSEEAETQTASTMNPTMEDVARRK